MPADEVAQAIQSFRKNHVSELQVVLHSMVSCCCMIQQTILKPCLYLWRCPFSLDLLCSPIWCRLICLFHLQPALSCFNKVFQWFASAPVWLCRQGNVTAAWWISIALSALMKLSEYCCRFFVELVVQPWGMGSAPSMTRTRLLSSLSLRRCQWLRLWLEDRGKGEIMTNSEAKLLAST